MKDGHKKNRVRLVKVNMSNGILITNEEIDQLKLELEEKEAKVAESNLELKRRSHNRARRKLLYPDLGDRRKFFLHQ